MNPISNEIKINIEPLEDSESKSFIQLSLSSPENGLMGTYGAFVDDDHPDVLEGHALVVEPSFRGKGIGERLMRKMVEIASKKGVKKMTSHVESQYSLDIRSRIFGKESMKFFLDSPTKPRATAPEQYAELPITFEQARASLARAETYEKDLEFRTIGFEVEVDITDNMLLF